MLHRLLASPDTDPVIDLDHDTLTALVDAEPLDTLQEFCSAHTPCAMMRPGALWLELAGNQSGYATAWASCAACHALAHVATPIHREASLAVVWWRRLQQEMAGRYPTVFQAGDEATQHAVAQQYLMTVFDAISMAVLLDTTAPSPTPEGPPTLDDNGDPVVLTH